MTLPTQSQIRDAQKWFQSNVSVCYCEVCKTDSENFKVIETLLQSALKRECYGDSPIACRASIDRAIDHLASTGRIRGDNDLQQLGTVFIGGEEFIVRRENHAAFTKLIAMLEPVAPGERG